MKLFCERRTTFRDPRRAGPEGIVDVSDEVGVDRLLEAYSFGIFPWPSDGYPTLWFCPAERGLLDFADVHVPRSLGKFLRRDPFTYSFNRDFTRVIDACAAVPRAGQDGTWITPRLRAAYLEFHRAGYAHSLEVWRGTELVGGLYGTYVGGVFGGESMFHLVDNASKAAVLKLIEVLRGNGLRWMDTQMVTDVIETFGGRYVPRATFLDRVAAARAHCRPLTIPAELT